MNKKLTYSILIAFILGIIGGILFPEFFVSINILGTLYVNLLKIIIVPILFFGISSTLSQMNSKLTSKITINTLITFIVMFISTFIINSILVIILNPGAGYQFATTEWAGELANPNFKDFLSSLIPTNILAAASNNSILPIILFASAFGIAVKKTFSVSVRQFLKEANDIFSKMLQWVMYLTPIGVFSLMGSTTSQYGISILFTSITYVGMAWLGCFITMALIMILPVWIFCKINPITYIKSISEIWIMTLSTCSSAATLPNTIRVCNEKFNIPKELTNVIVPLGCTIHMCGGAVSFSLLALFNIQMFNIPLTPYMFITMIVMALLINMGAPGIPGGGIIIGATYLNMLGIPLDFIGFYAGIYRLLDMAYTTMNVSGDITANCLVKESLS